MKILLDTQIFLWAIAGDPRLRGTRKAIFEDGDNELSLSAASVWEVLIKHQQGKLALPEPAAAFLNLHLERNRVALLPIRMPHLARYESLPPIHRDPFDRMIVAQAQAEGMPILTSDPVLRDYQVKCL